MVPTAIIFIIIYIIVSIWLIKIQTKKEKDANEFQQKILNITSDVNKSYIKLSKFVQKDNRHLISIINDLKVILDEVKK